MNWDELSAGWNAAMYDIDQDWNLFLPRIDLTKGAQWNNPHCFFVENPKSSLVSELTRFQAQAGPYGYL